MKQLFLLAFFLSLAFFQLTTALPAQPIDLPDPDDKTPNKPQKYCKFTIASNVGALPGGGSYSSGFVDSISTKSPITKNVSLKDEGLDNNVATISYEGIGCTCTLQLWAGPNFTGYTQKMSLAGNKVTVTLDSYWSHTLSSYQIYY